MDNQTFTVEFGETTIIGDKNAKEVNDMFYKWLTATEPYEFENVFAVDLANSSFKFAGVESTITDNYTTELYMAMRVNSNPYLTTVVMPKCTYIAARGITNVISLTYLELGNVKTVNQSLACSALTTLKVAEGQNQDLYLNGCNSLTVECLEDIVDRLADLSGQVVSSTLRLGTTNLAKLSEDYVAKVNAKNWDVY